MRQRCGVSPPRFALGAGAATRSDDSSERSSEDAAAADASWRDGVTGVVQVGGAPRLDLQGVPCVPSEACAAVCALGPVHPLTGAPLARPTLAALAAAAAPEQRARLAAAAEAAPPEELGAATQRRPREARANHAAALSAWLFRRGRDALDGALRACRLELVVNEASGRPPSFMATYVQQVDAGYLCDWRAALCGLLTHDPLEAARLATAAHAACASIAADVTADEDVRFHPIVAFPIVHAALLAARATVRAVGDLPWPQSVDAVVRAALPARGASTGQSAALADAERAAAHAETTTAALRAAVAMARTRAAVASGYMVTSAPPPSNADALYRSMLEIGNQMLAGHAQLRAMAETMGGSGAGGGAPLLVTRHFLSLPAPVGIGERGALLTEDEDEDEDADEDEDEDEDADEDEDEDADDDDLGPQGYGEDYADAVDTDGGTMVDDSIASGAPPLWMGLPTDSTLLTSLHDATSDSDARLESATVLRSLRGMDPLAAPPLAAAAEAPTAPADIGEAAPPLRIQARRVEPHLPRRQTRQSSRAAAADAPTPSRPASSVRRRRVTDAALPPH